MQLDFHLNYMNSNCIYFCDLFFPIYFPLINTISFTKKIHNRFQCLKYYVYLQQDSKKP